MEFCRTSRCFCFPRFVRALLAAFFCALLFGACASPDAPVDHGFGFDAGMDSPEVQVLAYRYGESNFHGTYFPKYKEEEGQFRTYASTSGPMRRGDFLYVKWKSKKTGEIFEETVDLKPLLPVDIRGAQIYFRIRQNQLFVYFVPEKREQNIQKPIVLDRYPDHKVVQIYPAASSSSHDEGEQE